jgi:hypothetical protein
MAITGAEEVQGSRRRFQRFPLRVPAVFFWKGPRGSRQKAEGLTRDISADGVFIMAESCPPMESSIEFEVKLPALDVSGPPVKIRAAGQVVRSGGALSKNTQGFAVHSSRKFVLARRVVWNEKAKLSS